ncbi:TNF receptor-associated factor 6-like [Corticium candelabrum]|uniref:TNF receptor-associated factor 6-like n=1 Tax=Corticium candelabrum TaxID=121492 RepID=UPI002E26FDF9|nr:TNF receptor-associated factor 6-like [Corticium candelabrum]
MAVYSRGGLDAHFVEPLNDRCVCPICHSAAREPMLTKCGHQFCQECLRPLIRNGNVMCPVCRTKLNTSEMLVNNMTKREILSLKILCDQCEKGCSWQGELRQRDEHNRKCGYVFEACSNDCGGLVMRMFMDYHKQNKCNRRILGCCYCDTELEYRLLTVHYEMCDSYPVYCPYKCGAQAARKDVETHISRQGVCPTSPLHCDFASAGCQFIGNREQLQYHLDKNIVYHLSLAMQTVSNVQERLEETDKELADVKKTLQHTESLLLSANYDTFRKSLVGDYLEKDDQKQQSVEYVKALLDKRIQISFVTGSTFVYLWKIESHQLAGLKCKPGCHWSVSSSEFNIRDPGLLLQLELKISCIQARFHSHAFEATVYWGQQHKKKLLKPNYLMSIFLHDNHRYRSRIEKEIVSSCPSGYTRGEFCSNLRGFGYLQDVVMRDGLLVVFELQSKV